MYAVFSTNMNANTPIAGLGTGDTINKVELAWILVGTDDTGRSDLTNPTNLANSAAAALAAGRGVTLTAGTNDGDIAAFQTTAGCLVNLGTPISGSVFVPAARVTENKSGGGTQAGAWNKGTSITITGGTDPLLPYFTDFEAGNAILANTLNVTWRDNISNTKSIWWDGWWSIYMTEAASTVGVTSVVDRFASAEMSGSYVARVSAASSAGSSGCVAMLMTQIRKSSFLNTSGTLRFDIRPKSLCPEQYSYSWVGFTPVDVNGASLVLTGDNKMTLWKNSGAAGHNTSWLMFTPTVNTTYSKTIDAKSFVEQILAANGKTWNDVDKIIVEFAAYSSAPNLGATTFYLDNFH